MPRYFLTIEHYDGQCWQDEDGADFPNLLTAVAEAREVVLELLIEAMRDDKARVPLRVIIADQTGTAVGTVTSISVVPAELKTNLFA